ncbi:erythromycin esterase family protein, partial [Methylobacillus sp. MM3]|uniref:erythromycin esterase family protein n=1 Tax=Methylobacillus sp. MM3 TaxID=1848039 RepID=UPI0013F4F558
IALIPGQNSTSFGNELYKLLGSEVYILGFTSHQGTAGRISVLDKFEIEKPKLQSFESWVNKLNYNFGFINFRTIRTDELFYMKGLFHKSEKGSWTNVFDGMFYIKNMYPCDKVD